MMTTLKTICSYRKEKIDPQSLQSNSYVSTDGMASNKKGIFRFSIPPAHGKVTRYLKDDILVSNIRPYFKKIWLADRDGGCSNDILVFTSNEHCSSEYLYWLLCNDKFFDYASATAKGTKMPRGDKNALLDYPIQKHNRQLQEAIVRILRPFQQQLAINSRINDHLLEMALSEYKELSRQSSSKRTLQDCTSLLCRGGAPKYCEKGKFHALNQRCIRNHKIDDANARRIENPRSREKLLRYGDILICSTGTGTLGRSAQVLCHDERVTVDSHVTIVRPAYEALVEYLGCWALSSEDQFESMAKGSTGQTELPRTELAELEIGFPDAASLNDFSGKTKPLFEAIQSNVRENQSLECLRDALLPKLMSGEIDVSRIGLRQLNGHLSES
ncbi:restriction endonuclease subunit S domain-containing protein [Adlercreutzia sp.]|uniref:hypothetical protein n=1 Tax=Adlercreutzia sp. TaxID=1872387 RepID=UPI002FAD3186